MTTICLIPSLAIASCHLRTGHSSTVNQSTLHHPTDDGAENGPLKYRYAAAAAAAAAAKATSASLIVHLCNPPSPSQHIPIFPHSQVVTSHCRMPHPSLPFPHIFRLPHPTSPHTTLPHCHIPHSLIPTLSPCYIPTL